ncbi:MAG: hypothetical protein KDJ36_10530 [Hyphomicrobiaceae bacterium]|nr:hypothetical protein [Hyphomicrobiaceae bacterium]
MPWSLADQVLSSAQNFIVGLCVARMAGVAEFGQFTLVFVIAMLAFAAQDLFLASPMMTYAGGRKRRTIAYFKAVGFLSLVLAFVAGLGAALIIAGIEYLQEGHLNWPLVLAGAGVTLANNQFALVKRIMFARNMGRTAFSLTLARVFALVVLWAGAKMLGFELKAAGWLTLLALSAGVVSLHQSVGLSLAPVRLALQRAVLRRHWTYARWLLLMVLISLGQEQLIWVWVGLLQGDEAVGGMRAGYFLLGTAHVVLLGMHNFIAREAAEAYSAGGHRGLAAYLVRQTAMLGLMVGSLLVVLALFAEFWMGLIFGGNYADNAGTLRAYCLIYAAIFVREVWVIYLRTLEMTRPIFMAFAISSTFAFIVGYPAILYAGVPGALAVVLTSHLIALAFVMIAIRKARAGA